MKKGPHHAAPRTLEHNKAEKKLMTLRICLQCKKQFDESPLRVVCSYKCSEDLETGRRIKNAARRARTIRAEKARREKAETKSFVPSFNPRLLEIGDVIEFQAHVGQIIAVVERGDTIANVWQRLKDERPELYEARTGIPPELPVPTKRYIVLIEGSPRVTIKWPYLHSIKGLANGSESKTSEEKEGNEGTEGPG